MRTNFANAYFYSVYKVASPFCTVGVKLSPLGGVVDNEAGARRLRRVL